jgi:peptidoglycan hydrolase CwlO-like protein
MAYSQKELAERLNKLSHSQNKLAYPQNELARRLSELSYSQNQLADSQNKLTHPQKELAERLSKLSYPQNELARRLNELFQSPKGTIIHKTTKPLGTSTRVQEIAKVPEQQISIRGRRYIRPPRVLLNGEITKL